MAKAQAPTVPRYDLFDGLGRKRRLRRAGLDPMELVCIETDAEETNVENTQEIKYTEAVA